MSSTCGLVPSTLPSPSPSPVPPLFCPQVLPLPSIPSLTRAGGQPDIPRGGLKSPSREVGALHGLIHPAQAPGDVANVDSPLERSQQEIPNLV